MNCDIRGLGIEQLEMACACMEAAVVAFINVGEREGRDTAELREILDSVHAAIESLGDV